MAELRSFLIGVAIAGVLLLFGALAFGLFGEGEGRSPSVVLLGTPPATRTPSPAPTRPVLMETPQPTPAANNGAQPTPANGATAPTNTPAPEATQPPQPTPEPTPEPTATPVPVPADTVYRNTVNPLVGGLESQLAYLMDRAAAPQVDDATWRQFSIQAAENLKTFAAQIAGVAVPDCLSGGHTTLLQGVNQAAQGADQMIAAANASDAGMASQAGGTLTSASAAIQQGFAAVQTPC